jgi:hypothetical protein
MTVSKLDLVRRHLTSFAGNCRAEDLKRFGKPSENLPPGGEAADSFDNSVSWQALMWRG